MNHGWNMQSVSNSDKGVIGQDPRFARLSVITIDKSNYRATGRRKDASKKGGSSENPWGPLDPFNNAPAAGIRNGLADGLRYIAMMMRCFLRYLGRGHRKLQRARDHPRQYSRRNLTERCDNGKTLPTRSVEQSSSPDET